MSPYGGWVTDYQRGQIATQLERLRPRRCTITRVVAGAAQTVGQHVPYRRGSVGQGGLTQEPGTLEWVTTVYVQLARTVDLRVRDTVTDEADGLAVRLVGVVLDSERRGARLAVGQVNR